MHPILRPALEFRVYAFRRTFKGEKVNKTIRDFLTECEEKIRTFTTSHAPNSKK